MKKFVGILILILIVGCQSSELAEKQVTGQTELITSNESAVESDLFAVRISMPKQVRTQESFTLNLELQNVQQQSVEIMTGSPVFYYVILDSNGKAMNSVARADLGIVQTVGKKEIIAEKQICRLTKPGNYEIYAVAEFALRGMDKDRPFRFETAKKRIVVE